MYADISFIKKMARMGIYHASEKTFGVAVLENKRKMRGGWKRK